MTGYFIMRSLLSMGGQRKMGTWLKKRLIGRISAFFGLKTCRLSIIVMRKSGYAITVMVLIKLIPKSCKFIVSIFIKDLHDVQAKTKFSA